MLFKKHDALYIYFIFLLKAIYLKKEIINAIPKEVAKEIIIEIHPPLNQSI